MSIFTFDYLGKKVEVAGPPGATEAQARAVFQQQVNSGALVGAKPGDVIGAASQLLGRVPGASAALGQAASGVPGSTVGALGTAFSSTGKSFVSATSSTRVADQTFSSINNSIRTTPPANGITTADFAKTPSGTFPIQGLSATDVRATVAQAATLSGQASTQITDTGGVGQFGFTGDQLETAGLLKPGTVSTYLASGTNSLTDVLKSPAVWTGQGGINNLDDFLNNPSAQSATQQSLMSSGLLTVQQLGIPVDSLTTKALSGLSLNAAKSPAETLDWAQGNLPADAQAEFDTTARDGAFAIGSADQAFNDAMTQQDEPGDSENTVDRQTLDAATIRIVGNDKIPTFRYGSEDRDPVIVADRKSLRKELDNITEMYQALSDELNNLSYAQLVAQADTKIAQFKSFSTQLTAFIVGFNALKSRALNGNPYSASLVVDLENDIADIQATLVDIDRIIRDLLQLKKQVQA